MNKSYENKHKLSFSSASMDEYENILIVEEEIEVIFKNIKII